MRTRQLDWTKRTEVLLEDKNAMIYEVSSSFDIVVLNRTKDNKRRITSTNWKEIP
jgi:hypothetical protein